MKILIGTNTYKKYKRQDIAIDSYVHLSNKYNCDIVDVQFVDENSSNYEIRTEHVLERSSLDVTSGDKKLPFVNDILNFLSVQDYDYFIYVNSDVILTNTIIKKIINEQPKCFACSRVDIADIDSYESVSNQDITPIRYEIAGFDAFVFNTKWFSNNSGIFQDYLVGQPCWDQVYATLMRIFGDSLFANNFPPCCFHIQHSPTWQVDKHTPERIFNHKGVEDRYLDRIVFNIFDNYLKTHLVRRSPAGRFMNVLSNEEEIEAEFFNKF